MTVIRMEHIRKTKMCSEGARRWFKRNNLDWNSFLAEGIEEELLLATGDALAAEVVTVAHNG